MNVESNGVRVYENATIHTHDRISFLRCRRKWFLSSPLGLNLEPKSAEKRLPLWFGSGFHFALEDFHGYNKFKHPEEAFEAYVAAFPEDKLPFGAAESIVTCLGMLGYYQKWLARRNQYQTLWIAGKPQVEVGFDLEISDLSAHFGFPVYYHGTFDRVVTDVYNRLWIEDYKTAASVDSMKLQTDPQISAYLWAAPIWFNHPIDGMLYAQFVKGVPEEPRKLGRGGFSKDKRQKTTHILYREALIKEYGKVPSDYVEFLNELAAQESIEGDDFIRKDLVYRSEAQRANAYQQIYWQSKDMIELAIQANNNPSASCLYTNPTRDCVWDCPFRQICIAMEDNADYKDMLEEAYQTRNNTAEGEKEEWRKRIKYPEHLQQGAQEQEPLPQAEANSPT